MNAFKNLQKFQLDNGLTVLLLPETTHNLVSYQVWFQVGSRLEEDHTRGLSHFIEHLFFKGTEKLGPGEIDRKLNEIGAFNNAATSKDYTFYYTVGTSDQFEAMFEIQTEMLLHPLFDIEETNKEREVVLAEMRRAHDNPGHKFYYKTMEMLYPQHSYRHPVLGSEDVIKNVSRETIVEYYETHYQAQNTTLVIAGNFNAEQARKMIEDNFGQLASNPDYQTRGVLENSFVPGETLFYANTHRNFSARCFQGPSHLEVKKILALDILSSVLTDGRSSRWKKHFKEDLGQVESIGFAYHTSLENGPVMIQALVKDDHWDNYHLELDREIKRLKQFYISREEFHKAVEYERIQASYRWQKMSERAQSLGFYSALGHLDFCLEYDRHLDELAMDDVIQVIDEYLLEESVQVQMLPQSTEIQPAKVPAQEESSKVKFKELKKNVFEMECESGLKAIYHYDPDELISTASVYIKNLYELISRFHPGACYLLQRVISRGTNQMKAQQIMETMDLLGARYSTTCSDHQTRKENYRCGLMAPSLNFKEAFHIFFSFFSEANFPQREIEKERDNILQEIKSLEDSLSSYCHFHMIQNFFEDHIFSTPFMGTEESVKKVNIKELEELYTVLYTPTNLFISISGPHPPESVFKMIQEESKRLGVLNLELKEERIPLEWKTSKMGTIDVQNNPKEQAYIMCVYQVPGYSSEEFYTALILNEILGGGMSSRFFRNMRDEKSYGYEIGSRYVPYLNYGIFYTYLGTEPARVDDASEDFRKEIKEIIEESVTQEELDKARSMIISRLSFSTETIGDKANLLGNLMSKGMGPEYLDQYIPKLKEVSLDKIQEFAKTHLNQHFEQRVLPQN